MTDREAILKEIARAVESVKDAKGQNDLRFFQTGVAGARVPRDD